MTAKLFISYSRKDSDRAHELIHKFEEMGYDVWVDWEDIPPATDWLDQVFRGIEGSDVFIFFISPDSITSEVCNVEVARADLNNKRIIPVVLRDVPAKDTNLIVRKLNWIFMRDGDDLEKSLGRFKDALELDFEWVAEHNRLQGRALEWHRGKETSLLLRGRELRRVRVLVDAAKGKKPLPTLLQSTFIRHSIQSERRRIGLWIVTLLALVVLAISTSTAIVQSRIAQQNEIKANQNADMASENARIANTNAEAALNAQAEAEIQRELALEQKKIAEDQALIALAQQKAARAQIYQIQPGELYTSTLFAISSWTLHPSSEANEILRKNISLLPIPVAEMHHNGQINSISFNQAGDLFVSADADGQACVWNASDGEMRYCVTSSKSVNDAVFSPNGAYLIIGDSSGLVQILNASDGMILGSYRAPAIVWDVDVRKNNDQVAVTRDDGRITLLDIPTGQRKYDLQAAGSLRIASFSPNGTYIAAASSTGTVTLWNINTGQAVSSGRHRGEVHALAFSPDSRYLVTGGVDGYAVVARTFTGQEIYRLLHEDWVEDIAFNPDSSWFATVSNDRRIRLWDTPDGSERLRLSQASFVQEAKVSADGQWLATTGADHTVRVWNSSSGIEMFQIPLKGAGTALDFSDDGGMLITGDTSGEVKLLDISVMPTPENNVQFIERIGDVVFSPSGELVAASDGPRIWLFRSSQLPALTSRTLGNPIQVMVGNVNNIVFSPDSKWVGGVSDTGQVFVHNVQTRQSRTLLQNSLQNNIAFLHDGGYLVVTDNTGKTGIWDLTTYSEIIELPDLEEFELGSVAVSPDRIALGLTDRIELYTLDGKHAGSIESLGDHTHLSFNSDGSMLASSSSSGLISVWRADEDSYALNNSIRKEFVQSLAFNPEGDELAVGSRNFVYLIDPFTVRETARIPHSGDVTGVSFSSDKKLVTSSLRVLSLWDLSQIQTFRENELVSAACSRLRANLSESQWTNLFGDEKYQVLCEKLPVP